MNELKEEDLVAKLDLQLDLGPQANFPKSTSCRTGGVYGWVEEAELASLFVSSVRNMACMGASHMRPPLPLPGHTHATAFVHIAQMLGGVHQRGGRRGARRAAHRERVGPERFGRSLLKLTSSCRSAGRRERAGCCLRAGAMVGSTGILP